MLVHLPVMMVIVYTISMTIIHKKDPYSLWPAIWTTVSSFCPLPALGIYI